MPSNGECYSTNCMRLLIANSPIGRSVAQSSCLCRAKSRRYCSISLFICSVCPFTWGWYVVISCPLILSFSYSILMNQDMNCGPQLLIIPRGSLWSQNMLRMWRSVMPLVSTPFMMRAKCVCFEYRSTYVMMAVYVFFIDSLAWWEPSDKIGSNDLPESFRYGNWERSQFRMENWLEMLVLFAASDILINEGTHKWPLIVSFDEFQGEVVT